MDIAVTEEQMQAYANGALVQHAFPNLSADEREFIMTGITAQEWDQAFRKSTVVEDEYVAEMDRLDAEADARLFEQEG